MFTKASEPVRLERDVDTLRVDCLGNDPLSLIDFDSAGSRSIDPSLWLESDDSDLSLCKLLEDWLGTRLSDELLERLSPCDSDVLYI